MAQTLNYTKVTIDLTIARTGSGAPVPEVPIGADYNSVTVLRLPVGAAIEMAFGENSETKYIPFDQGMSFQFEDDKGCPLFVNSGLFIRNPAGAGLVILLVGFRSGGDS